MLDEELASRGLLAPLLDHHAGAAHNLDGLALLVVLAETSPLSQQLGVLDLIAHDKTVSEALTVP